LIRPFVGGSGGGTGAFLLPRPHEARGSPGYVANFSIMQLQAAIQRLRAATDSDVDILVDFHGPMGLNFVDLADELEDLLGTKVGFVSRRGVKPGYLEVISKDLVHV
jgi:predicted nucleotidyltransferase